MGQYIDKSALVEELNKRKEELERNILLAQKGKDTNASKTMHLYIGCYNSILSFLDTLEEKEVTEMRTVKHHGYVVRSEGYNGLEFYEKPPKRVFGTYVNHWTYTDPREFSDVLPLAVMPNLEWEDEPVEVILETKVLEVINNHGNN